MSASASSKRRLLFLTVNSSFSHSSLALPLLHTACRELTDWEWLRYDMTIAQDIMAAVRAIYAMKCDLVVTDLYLFNRQTALELLRRCHTLAPECKFAVGGPECLGDGAAELLQQYPWLDRIFRGEGEEIFRKYLEEFGSAAPSSSRIVPAEENGVYTGWENSDFPVSDPFFVTDKPFVQMETSRGCPMKCFYCTSGGTRTRYRSLEQVRQELTRLSEKGVKELRLLDRTFNLPQERGAALLRMFREEFPHMRFHLELHPQFLNDALKEELSLALPGQLHIETGIQCLSPEVQRLSGRCSSTAAVEEGMRFLCSLSAFETHADLLAGLPGQRWSHILADTEALMSFNVAEIQLEILKVLPGTPMRQVALQHGIKYSPAAPYDVMATDTMTLEEIQYARDLSRLLDLTCNTSYLHSTVCAIHRKAPGSLPGFLEFFHRSGGDSSAVWDLKKRFCFLLDYCREHDFQEETRLLAYQWLKAGLPPAQGADIHSEKSSSPPDAALLLEGSEACRSSRETRFRQLELKDKIYFFAFNRGYSLNRPAAIWSTEKES